MKRYYSLVLLLSILSFLLVQAAQAQLDAQYSLESWRHMTHYAGPVCILPTEDQAQYDRSGRVICLNHVPTTGASINAGSAYEMWVGCYEHHEHYACIMAGDK